MTVYFAAAAMDLDSTARRRHVARNWEDGSRGNDRLGHDGAPVRTGEHPDRIRRCVDVGIVPMTRQDNGGLGRMSPVKADEVQRAIEDFAAGLNDLRSHAGKPSFARIHNLSKKRDTVAGGKALPLPRSTASDAIQGKRLPTIATVLAFVEACRMAADEAGMVIDPERFDLTVWQHRWRTVRDLRDAPQNQDPPDAFDDVRPAPESSSYDVELEEVEGAAGSSPEPDAATTGYTVGAGRSSPFVEAMTTRISRLAAAYSADLEAIGKAPAEGRRHAEQRALDSLEDRVALVLDTYDPPGIRRRGDTLVFASIYFEADALVRVRSMSDPRAKEYREAAVPPEYVAALLAAETEFHGPVRLSYRQKAQLAEIYERLGHWMVAFNLFAHAAFAFRRAALAYYQNEEPDAQERCELAHARARRRTLPPGPERLGLALVDLLCGYGYLPFRMLGWMSVQIVVFTTAIAIASDMPLATAVYMGILNYFSPAGLGDTEGIGQQGRILMMIESVTGTLFVLAFAVLLSRRLLRIGLRR
ncbi:hypothetical protein [Nocardia asiatica]|uniref:hypothetical protein n=1 Tax=Nocardia asiatica TaxID=209252 RepID=UPI003EE14BD9